MNARTLLLAATAVFFASPAAGQTRFALQAGVLVPLSDMEKVAEPSLRGVLRLEYQPVNAIGQRRLISIFGYLSYVDLVAKNEPAEGSQPQLFGLGGGLRFYSKHAPLFLGAGAGYSRWRPGGDLESVDGLDAQVNAGFMLPLWFFLAEVEASLHQIFQENEDFQYATGMLGVAMPF